MYTFGRGVIKVEEGRELGAGGLGFEDDNCTSGYAYDSVASLYMLFLSLVIGSLLLWTQRMILPSIPYALKLFAIGTALGVLNANNENLGILSTSINMWSDINPNLLLAVFIPALTFADAVNLDTHMLKRIIFEASVLAIVNAAAIMVTLAFLVNYLVPYNWSLFTVLTFAAALSSIDPPATNAILTTIKIPPKTVVILNGESHIGSPISLIMFSVFLSLRLGTTYNEAELTLFVFNKLFSAIAIGFVLGLAGYYVMTKNTDRTSRRSILIQITILLSLAYLSYIVSFQNAQASGVTSTFISSLVIATTSWPVFASRRTMYSFWQTVGFFANTLIFVLAGLIVGPTIYSNNSFTEFGYDEYLGVIFIYLLLLGLRFVVVMLLFPLLKNVGYGLNIREALGIGYSNFKGAICLTLAIAYDRELELLEANSETKEARQVIFTLGGVVFLSLLLNGTSFHFVSKKLGLLRTAEVKARLLEYVQTHFNKEAAIAYEECAETQKYVPHDVDIIVKHVTSLQNPDTDLANGGARELKSNFVVRKNSNDSAGDADYAMNDFDMEANLEVKEKGNPATITEDEEENNGVTRKVTFGRRNTVRRLLQKNRSGKSVAREDKNLTKEVRELFLSALKAAYWEQIVQGIIPKGSHIGRNLLNSVEYALDRVGDDAKLADYHRLHLPKSTDALTEPSYLKYAQKLTKFFPEWLIDFFGARVHREVVTEYCYIASCMIEAHIQAEKMLADFVGEDDRNLPEVDRVLMESEEEIEEAQLLLEKVNLIDPEIVELVQNKKMVSIILQKQKEFVDTLREQNIIDEHTHHELLISIRTDLKHIRGMKVTTTHNQTETEMFSSIRRALSKDKR